MKNPLVSVCMITYNHEKYIREAIEGVLMQKTNFDFELVVANDCSPDNSDNIVTEILNNHPKANRIKYFRHGKNMGGISNFIFALNQCTGKYIALCEGDDYWTDPYKLQKQVDFLEANEEYTLCFHLVEYFYQNNEKPSYINPAKKFQKRDYSIYDLIRENFISTCSTMYRWQFHDLPLPELFSNHLVADYPLHFLHATKGKIGMIPEVMGRYRIHQGGVWSLTAEEIAVKRLKDAISMYNDFNVYTNEKYSTFIDERIYYFERYLMHRYINDNLFKESMKLFRMRKEGVSVKDQFRFYLHYYFPNLYSFLRMIKNWTKNRSLY
ncbi:glycosyltransferase [candidate division WOR-3 bacterium]|nr:glycosyltransferase [candidate division WOR-3 bacterium]